jgi:phosphoserine phosphatase RsbU/P
MLVLIAEDDSISGRMLGRLLGGLGHSVITVGDGPSAFAALTAEGGPRLAILDWMMPGYDGVEVIRRVRAAPTGRTAYLMLLTSRGGRADLVCGLEAGANDFLTKPFDPAELRARLNVGCRFVELQAELARRVAELEDSLARVQTLEGLISICMHCHRIHAGPDSWEKLESYIGRHSRARFSHGLCPTCLETYYPEDGEPDPIP